MEKKSLSLTPNKKAKVIANKRTMNFAHHQSSIDWKKLGIILGAALLVIGLFVKFAIVDQLAIKNEAIRRRDDATQRLAMVNARMAKYHELETDYNRYTDALLSGNEAFLVSRVEILDLLEEYLYPVCNVRGISVRDNTITLPIDGLTLSDTADLIEELEALEQVSDVRFFSASSSDSIYASVGIAIDVQRVDAQKEAE